MRTSGCRRLAPAAGGTGARTLETGELVKGTTSNGRPCWEQAAPPQQEELHGLLRHTPQITLERDCGQIFGELADTLPWKGFTGMGVISKDEL